MRHLAQFHWTDGVACATYGRRVGIRVTDASILDKVAGSLPPSGVPLSADTPVQCLYSIVTERGAGPDEHCVYAGPRLLNRSSSLDIIRRDLAGFLDLQVALTARGWLFVHAGVVAIEDRAVLVTGRSMSGKTTLVRELVNRGARYYSDDRAVVDEQGRVFPYARPLSVREGSSRYDVVPPKAALPDEPLPVGLVVFTAFSADSAWTPKTLTGGEAALELLVHALSARVRPMQALRVASLVCAQAERVASARGEAGPVADWLMAHMRRTSHVH